MRIALHLTAAVLLLLSNSASAAWLTSSAEGTTVCAATNYQGGAVTAPDGSGGVIIAWTDFRAGGTGSERLYAQRVSRSGNIVWATDGVPVCSVNGSGYDPRIISDSNGGAIVVWVDKRTSSTEDNLYAQRINASGTILWPSGGVAICTATAIQRYQRVAKDANGGAIIAWEDHRSGPYDVYAQRINAAGVCLWGENGRAVCDATDYQGSPDLFTDAAGSAYVLWTDVRSAPSDLFAQRLNLAGADQWTSNGVQITNGPGGEGYPVMTPDDQGGFIAAWFDTRQPAQYDVYAQRVNGSGTPLWPMSGVAVATTIQTEQGVCICSDGANGAIVAWYTYPGNATAEDIYAQRLNSAGVPQWTTNGVLLCNAPWRQEAPQLMKDAVGGAMVAWGDDRSSTGRDIYMQRVSHEGVPQWAVNGVPVAAASRNENFWNMTSDGLGGVIIAWDDDRDPFDFNTYANFIGPSGGIGVFSSAQDWQLFN